MMSYTRLVVALGLTGTLFTPWVADAQSRDRDRSRGRARAEDGRDRERAVPRGSVRSSRPREERERPRDDRAAPSYSPYVNRSRDRVYRPGVNFSFFYGYPGYYGAYGYGLPYRYRTQVYAAPYGYGYDGYVGRPYGGVRIDLPQRYAEVYIDGYFAGTVDDFDGRLQQANIEAGPHRIEVSAPGFQALVFDVRVEPGRTITYRGSLRPAW